MSVIPDLPPLIGESRPFQDLMERVSRVAPLDRPVLVIGERGSGKELIGVRLHFQSVRWDGPFVQLNCAALPETLIETELFGHEAGAFTGAGKMRVGRFEMADSGTLFLDEIANATLPVQEKVLRVIEYGAFERVGGNKTLNVDVRLIGVTNVDLPAEADAGRFRHDLLDRLAFDVLTVPPLRARRDDISLLAAYFARAMALELGGEEFDGFSRAASEALMDYDWPGNVRELKNVVERAVYRHRAPGEPVDSIVFDPFASPYRPTWTASKAAQKQASQEPGEPGEPAANQPVDLRSTLGDVERRLLEQALAANRHNQKAAADHLSLSYHQFRNRLKKHALI